MITKAEKLARRREPRPSPNGQDGHAETNGQRQLDMAALATALGVSADAIRDRRQLVRVLKQTAAQVRGGQVTIDVEPQHALPPKGTRITINGAARKYGVAVDTVWRWAHEYKIVAVLERGKGQGSATWIDEHDVAREFYNPTRTRGPRPGFRRKNGATGHA